MSFKKYLTSDFEGYSLDKPAKLTFFNFVADRSGGWPVVIDRVERGCYATGGQIRGQYDFFMSIVDREDLEKRALEFYDLPKNAPRKNWTLDDKVKSFAKVKIQGMTKQFRRNTAMIYGMIHNQPMPSSFFNDDTPKVKKEDPDMLWDVLEMCKKLTDSDKQLLVRLLSRFG